MIIGLDRSLTYDGIQSPSIKTFKWKGIILVFWKPDIVLIGVVANRRVFFYNCWNVVYCHLTFIHCHQLSQV